MNEFEEMKCPACENSTSSTFRIISPELVECESCGHRFSRKRGNADSTDLPS